MKKTSKILILLLAIFTTLNTTFAYFSSSSNIVSRFNTKSYEININGNDGIFGSSSVVVSKDSTTLPTPTRLGYTFKGYSDKQNGEIIYSTNINNMNEINNLNIYAVWEINSYIVDVNPVIDGIAYNSGLSGFTFDVWVDEKLVADDVIDWYQSVAYDSSVRVKTNSVTGRNTSYDKTFVIGTSSMSIEPTWSTNTYEGHFYLNGVHRLTTYNKYGSTISTPNTSASALGYDSNFYYISGYTPWTTWIQPDYAVGFTINMSEYNCTASFGSVSSSNADAQLLKIKNAGYGFCRNAGWGAVECTSNYSNVIALYNNAWNFLPRSGSGYSIYKQIGCDSGWSTYSRR